MISQSRVEKATRSVSVLAFALAAAGCARVFEYPAAQDEATAALCADGTDNNFNGKIDCADTTCDGFCPEEQVSTCTDGRDNDGDGLADDWDPRCWRFGGPHLVRCASQEPTDFEERFDTAVSDARWQQFGGNGGAAPRVSPALDRQGRKDSVITFPEQPGSVAALPGIASRMPFDGDWTAFELDFHARVPPGGKVQIAFVADSLVSSEGSPAQVAALAPFALEIDARDAPALNVVVSGTTKSVPYAKPDGWHAFRLATSGDSLVVQLDGAEVLQTERPALSASRLVVRGAADGAGNGGTVQVDDLHLLIAGHRPCAVACPQIPFGRTCRLDASGASENVGYSVSVGHDPTGGRYCAVLTSGELGQDAPTRAQSSSSDAGDVWTAGGTLLSDPAEQAGQVVGVGVARDAEAGLWRAAVGWAMADSVKLLLMSSADCATWSEVVEAAVLPADAQAPSYLIPGTTAPYEVYFTRPAASASEGASLWRLGSMDGVAFASEDAPVAVFPRDGAIETPVALSRIGPRDIALTHRISPATGVLGLGLWVARDDTLSTWDRSSVWPLLESDSASAGFDSEGILGGAVVWQTGRPALLYGAKGTAMSRLHVPGAEASITAGTGRLVMSSGAGAPQGTALPIPSQCGDAVCQQGEACASCSMDCGPCDGELILADGFERGTDWQGGTLGGNAYVSDLSQRVNLTPRETAWLYRKLDVPLVGDWELQFDVQWLAPTGGSAMDRCTAFFGLVREPDATDSEAAAVLAQLDQQVWCDPGVPAFSVAVHAHGGESHSLTVGGSPSGSVGACLGMSTGLREAWHRVVLQRSSGRVSVRVTGRDSCADLEQAESLLAYSGPVDRLDRLVLGWGGRLGSRGVQARCESATAGLSIDNVVLRKLPCPESGQSCTDPDTGQSVCVDTATSPEHCGACNTKTRSVQQCIEGHGACAASSCQDSGGKLECVDLSSDPHHCGACGHRVQTLETCGDGFPRASMAQTPEGFAIDATEVTREQYAAWLATYPPASLQPASCSWNTTFVPSCAWPPDDGDRRPVDCVDWCDAFAYCAGVGKRLCGKVTGGAASWEAPDTTESQWFAACSSGGVNAYPYGQDYVPKACNGTDNKLTGAQLQCAVLRDTGALSGCQPSQTGYAGVFDLSGNAREWVDACSADASREDSCRVAGGSTCDKEASLKCGSFQSESRGAARQALGFRCCSL